MKKLQKIFLNKDKMSLVNCLENMEDIKHYSVMNREVIDLLDIKNKKIVVDCTVGLGGHAFSFLEVMPQDAFLIGIDKDEEALQIAGEKLKKFAGRFTLVKSDFSDISSVLKNMAISTVDAFLFDLGVSSYQLKNPERGFSFLSDGYLDMRMDKNAFLSAYDLVNNLSENELEAIFNKFGEERFSHRIAHFIVLRRQKEPIATTSQLAQLVCEAVPYRLRESRIHPATRIFQALRIAVNRELDVLTDGIYRAISLLNRNGRIGVISFHSLEDRIIKNIFRENNSRGTLELITKKPILPSEAECIENSPSHSAKLRVAEKIK